MKFILQTPKQTLNKAFLKQRPLRSEIDLFKSNLIRLLGKVDEIEREENQKNHIRDFLRDTFYKENNEINTKDSKDLVIHLGKSNKDKVGVIIEAKRPGNKNEMLSVDKPNAKALHEIILYYFDERTKAGNNELKHLIITNVYEWFIIDANYFDKVIYRNGKIKKLYETYTTDKKDTPFFYEEVSKIIPQIDSEIPCTYFDIRVFEKTLNNNDKADDKNLIALLKILSPFHLLKVPFADDSNKLNSAFYKELLHLVGLEEAKENGKFVIRRKPNNRNAGSLIENSINILETEDVLHKVPDITSYGETKPERLFNISLELSITWINRILFLKLLEGQLITYHKGDRQYRFLNSGMINDFDELHKLFHQVLARTSADRTETIQKKYNKIPYLNSSLFEISELEDQTIKINSLDNSAMLELLSNTVLKEEKKKSDRLPVLDYLFKFLDAFDFASEGTEDIQEDSKTLINASVLGLIFEKINGYKDGSIFTPGFITMYMSRKALRLAVIQKFKEKYEWNIEGFSDIKNYTADRKNSKDILEFNALLNSIKMCDPAVGSGHFLVSLLNEMIAIKYELGILADENGARINDYEITIENDELIVTDLNGDIFEYQLINGKPGSKETQRFQKTLFHEKQTIIENCLFGVDINPNSVKICRLRLWIELLKNAYYKEETNFSELETLPNIDINIKCGNSLISRFPLDADLSKALKSIKYNIEAYRGFVSDYKNEKNREVKRGLQKIIDSIKSDFRTEINSNDPKVKKLKKLKDDITFLPTQYKLYGMSDKEKNEFNKKMQLLTNESINIENQIEEIRTNAIYKNAFEWRFEFPEVLNNNGDFEGFGNPPYIRAEALDKKAKEFYNSNYKTAFKQYDILVLFLEKGIELLKDKSPLSFIVSNKFLISDYGAKLRKYIMEESIFTEAIDVSYDQVFKEASVYPYIISLKKEKNKIIREKNEILFMPSLILKNFIKIPQSSFMNVENQIFDFTSFEHFWMKKVEIDALLLGGIINITRGFRPPKEELKFFSNKNEKYLIGSDIKGPYEINWSGNLVLYDEKQIEESKSLYIFKQPKIFFRDIGLKFNAAYDENGLLCLKTIYFGYLENNDYDLKFLIALLNSKLINQYFSNKYSISHIAGGYLRFRKQFVQNIPIKQTNSKGQKPFIDLVDKIISQKQQSKDTTDLEKQIDKLVYKLYDLTEDEIAIIENKK